jgi:acid phosphatase family membrane protein YuiD
MSNNYNSGNTPYNFAERIVINSTLDDTKLFTIDITENKVVKDTTGLRHFVGPQAFISNEMSNAEFNTGTFKLINPTTGDDLTLAQANAMGFTSNVMAFRQFGLVMTSLVRHYQTLRDINQ